MKELKSNNSAQHAVGKLVGGALYLHCSAFDALAQEDQDRVRRAETFLPSGFIWSVVKLNRKIPTRISFLDYEDFEAAAFPALRSSCTVQVNIGEAVVRTYKSDNPPILHRKELLLKPSDPRREIFSALTQRLEHLGLFKNMNRMGRRRPWEDALEAAGLDANGVMIG